MMIAIMLWSGLSDAQTTLNLKQNEQIMKMDEGVELMNKGDFVAADQYFREALQNLEVVPAELCFYFGKNSYHLEKYSQSIKWLNKYIELKGTSGVYFDQAAEYLTMAEEDRQDSQPQETGEQLSRKNKSNRQREILNCEEVPFVVCPSCRGEGIMVERGPLGAALYKKCPYCAETGRLSCENYKLYIRGELQPAQAEK
ncbi:MAG: hypothetical protein ACLFUB_03000 [Cyclobacteriaceae bacterium]